MRACVGIVRGQVREHPDAPRTHGLLRARRQRPRRRRAAEQRDELGRLMPGMGAPSQVPPPMIAGRNRQAQAV